MVTFLKQVVRASAMTITSMLPYANKTLAFLPAPLDLPISFNGGGE